MLTCLKFSSSFTAVTCFHINFNRINYVNVSRNGFFLISLIEILMVYIKLSSKLELLTLLNFSKLEIQSYILELFCYNLRTLKCFRIFRN